MKTFNFRDLIINNGTYEFLRRTGNLYALRTIKFTVTCKIKFKYGQNCILDLENLRGGNVSFQITNGLGALIYEIKNLKSINGFTFEIDESLIILPPITLIADIIGPCIWCHCTDLPPQYALSGPLKPHIGIIQKIWEGDNIIEEQNIRFVGCQACTGYDLRYRPELSQL